MISGQQAFPFLATWWAEYFFPSKCSAEYFFFPLHFSAGFFFLKKVSCVYIYRMYLLYIYIVVIVVIVQYGAAKP